MRSRRSAPDVPRGSWWRRATGPHCALGPATHAICNSAIVLCTDAASEGLNLQTASTFTLVNYDLPWNPMRVEQRIGRIDRINQTPKILSIQNYVMLGTVEEQVYDVLMERIKVFEGSVGELQPILGEVESLVSESTADDVTTNLESRTSLPLGMWASQSPWLWEAEP